MKHVLLSVLLIGILCSGQSAVASGAVERACLRADRANASRALCGCIQDVADSMLTRGERSKVVRFFKDPHKSQATRQSDRNPDERFWKKYKRFGQKVRAYCR